MQGYKLTGSTGFTFSNIDKSGSSAGSPLGMLDLDCAFTEPTVNWPLPGRDVPCGLCDIPETMSRLCISSPNVACGGAVGSWFVCGWMTAGTLNSVIRKKHFCPGRIAPSEWTRSVRAVRDTPVADHSTLGVNATRRVTYYPLNAVSPFLLALSVS